MALGFGFNKAKILSSAEKFVQQGKLQNAIAEYDKVLKQDPRDLTVLNTIGDLFARLGRVDQATEYFRKVGEAYSADGFVVKAIAMYKKLTKLNPSSLESAVRLAELYTQQGLYNDARAQYASVADQYLKNNDRERATGILKKMLDLDPENAAMQTKVADLYIKLGRNKEALEIYFNSAHSLYQRSETNLADEALSRVLKLDPNYAPALLLRGQIAAEAGNNEVAIENLGRLPNLDSHPEAFRPLMQAYVHTKNFEKAEPLVTKLVESLNDLSAATLYASALLEAGEAEQAISIYRRYSERFLKENNQNFVESITAAVSKAKDSAPALLLILGLLEKTGAAGHSIHEVQELLAHAYVQIGQLEKAADLYQTLSETEPENPLHEQNHRQIISRMGKDAVTRELSEEEGRQALMVDELESIPAVAQEYPPDLAELINAALTDSELFASYNVPEKAIAPLENALPKAPGDIRLRQRLASLYIRTERFADAANCCSALAEIHHRAGLGDQAQQFRDMAARYTQQAAGAIATAPVVEVAPEEIVPQATDAAAADPAAFQASSVSEFAVKAPDEQSSVAEFDLSTVSVEALPDAVATPATSVPEPHDANEWEDMLTVESPASAEADAQLEASSATESDDDDLQELSVEETPEEILEEAQFYVSQSMMVEAQSAIARLEATSPRHPALKGLHEAVRRPQVPETSVHNSGRSVRLEEVTVAPEEPISASSPAKSARPHPEVDELTSIAAGRDSKRPTPRKPAPAAASEESDILDVEQEPIEPESILDELIPEVAAGEPASFTAPPIHVAPAARSAVHSTPTAPPQPVAASPLAGLVSDLEEALGDLAPPAPAAKRIAVAAPTSAAASQIPMKVAAKAAPVRSSDTSAEANPSEAQSMLSDLLDEFKEGVDEPTGEADDPETHYNLGVAFREMGLLDEAIGELQKVCRAVDKGVPFHQSIQAYTWLAQCLVEKGVPQAAIRWYERALNMKGINEDSKLAVYYELAAAFESAGNKKAALDNFMEVYGSNIDYRDVADRIRSLQK